MPRISYEPATRDAILKATTDARAAGKTWNEAHAAAVDAGYKGGLQGIIKLSRASDEGGSKSKRKPGRPKGSLNKKTKAKVAKIAAPKKAKVSTGGASDIFSMVENLVKSRINAALDLAISALQGARH